MKYNRFLQEAEWRLFNFVGGIGSLLYFGARTNGGLSFGGLVLPLCEASVRQARLRQYPTQLFRACLAIHIRKQTS